MQVIDSNSENTLNKGEILGNLESLVKETEYYAYFNPSIFTAEDRDKWAIVYDKMRTSIYI